MEPERKIEKLLRAYAKKRKADAGDAFTLQKFHDAFIQLGPLPLPLVRKAMLGEVGSLL